MNLDTSDFTSSRKFSPASTTPTTRMNSLSVSGASNGLTITSRHTKYGNHASTLQAYLRKTARLSCSKRNERRRNLNPVAMLNAPSLTGKLLTVTWNKWQGLNYEHYTWELQKETKLIAKQYIATYWKREAEAKFPYKGIFQLLTRHFSKLSTGFHESRHLNRLGSA